MILKYSVDYVYQPCFCSFKGNIVCPGFVYRLEGRRRTRVGSGDQRKEGPGNWIPDIRTKEMCGPIRDPGTEKSHVH